MLDERGSEIVPETQLNFARLQTSPAARPKDDRRRRLISKAGCTKPFARSASYELIVVTEKNLRSSPRMVRVLPVTVRLALDRMSSELLPALSSTDEPGAEIVPNTQPLSKNLRTPRTGRHFGAFRTRRVDCTLAG